MITVFKYEGETALTCSWSYRRNSLSTVLQVFRWRVPEPAPRYIEVGIFSRENFIVRNFGGKEKYSSNPGSRSEDIVWNVVIDQVNSDTISYLAEGTGSPFESITIPRYFLKGKEEEKLQVMVKWLKEKEDDPNILIPIA